MFRKKLKKGDLPQIMEAMFDQDLKAFPRSKESGNRYIWCFMQIGEGSLKFGFSSGVCSCKGCGVALKKGFEEEFGRFLKGHLKDAKKKILVAISIQEMGLIIRRLFCVGEDRIIPKCKFWKVRESLTLVPEERIFKGKKIREYKMKLTHFVEKQGYEKLRLPKKLRPPK